MKLSTRYQAKGKFRIIKGKVKGVVARFSANRTLGIKGKLQVIAGRMQVRIGRAQGAIGL